MLILERKRDEQIVIGDGIVVTVVEIRYGSIRVGIDAPKQVPIARDDMRRPEPKPRQIAKT